VGNQWRDPTERAFLRALKEEHRQLLKAGELGKAQELSRKFLAEGEDLPEVKPTEVRKSSGAMPARRDP
jgi:hypothetical protein